MQSTYLDFERPLEELDRALEEARARKSPVAEIAALETRERDLETQLYGDLSPWYRVQLSRHPDRPQTLEYAGQIFDEFTELHGDRGFADDPSIVGGFARFEDRPVMLVGHQRGRTTQEKLRRNFGMAMSFALIGLKVPGIRILDPRCVDKTFPEFFERLESLRAPA